MRTSVITAAVFALAVALWLASPHLGLDAAVSERPAEEETASATAEQTAADEELTRVRVRQSVAEPVSRELTLNAHTEPSRAVELKAEVSGRVVAIHAERGDVVEAGDLIVAIDRREREAMLEMAKAQLEQRRLEDEAARRLGEKGFQATTKVAEAAALLEEAQAKLKQMEIERAHTEVRAPFSGILDKRPVEIGDYLDVGGEIGRLVELDPVIVSAYVPEASVLSVERGMLGHASFADGRTLDGTVRYIAREANPLTRTFEVELELANPQHAIPAGVSTELSLDLAEVEAHKVSPALLSLDDEGRIGIKTVDSGNRVVFHPARIVRSDIESVYLAGLPAELRIITVGHGFVEAGQRVEPVSTDGEPVPVAAIGASGTSDEQL